MSHAPTPPQRQRRAPTPAVEPSLPPGLVPQNSGRKLPGERDDAMDSAGRTSEELLRQAARDLQAGQVDTDLRATPGLDAPRRRKLVPHSR
jgi:hypothetical protein